MAILTLNNFLAAKKQRLSMYKTAARTTVAAIPFSLFELAGSPAGTLAVGNTANGLVPTDATAGYPAIDAFDGGNTGYISCIEFSNTVASRLVLYDRLFSAGAYSFNSNVTLASQPSFASRVLIDGVNQYNGLEIWVEAVTAFTGTPSVNITYVNQSGTAGRTTGTVSLGAALTVGRMVRIPLQAGDTGVQQITNVTFSVATVGTANVHIMRPIKSCRIATASDTKVFNMLDLGKQIIFDTSALFLMVQADGTSSGLPECYVEIAQG